MKYVGVRCSNNDYCLAILSGTMDEPTLEYMCQHPFPKKFSPSGRLKWFLQELEEKMKDHKIKMIGIKKCESLHGKQDQFIERIENEAMVFLAADKMGVKLINRKAYRTIAKDFGFKGKKESLKEVDWSIFSSIEKLNDKSKDAILAAWSLMKKNGA